MKRRILIVAGVLIVFGVSLIYLYPRFSPKPTPVPPANFENAVITIERSVCFGPCPVYKLTIFGNGNVVYNGEKFVKVVGERTAKIPEDKIKELVGEFYKTDFFSLKEKYTEKCDIRGCVGVTDLPTTIVSITVNGQTKKVIDYYGAPEKLKYLENKIDEISGSRKWVKGD